MCVCVCVCVWTWHGEGQLECISFYVTTIAVFHVTADGSSGWTNLHLPPHTDYDPQRSRLWILLSPSSMPVIYLGSPYWNWFLIFLFLKQWVLRWWRRTHRFHIWATLTKFWILWSRVQRSGGWEERSNLVPGADVAECRCTRPSPTPRPHPTLPWACFVSRSSGVAWFQDLLFSSDSPWATLSMLSPTGEEIG